MSNEANTVNDAIALAQKVLDEAKDVKLSHSYNYVGGSFTRNKYMTRNLKKVPPPAMDGSEEAPVIKQPKNDQQVVYTNPGQARVLELVLPPLDPRAGTYPQHNSPGKLPEQLEMLPACGFDQYRTLYCTGSLKKNGFVHARVSLTRKKVYALADQFCHLSIGAFKQMMDMVEIPKKRDFDTWIYKTKLDDGFFETKVAYVNQKYDLIQFIQVITRDSVGNIVRLQHVMYDGGDPVVINETMVDEYGNTRQIAHIGAKGADTNVISALERFDDGSICWLLSRQGTEEKATAVMKETGEIYILDPKTGRAVEDINKLTDLDKLAGRNLGAEGIDPHTQEWTGSFDPRACVQESEDKYILRREYKEAVRNQLSQIIDGAAVPGLNPIFNI